MSLHPHIASSSNRYTFYASKFIQPFNVCVCVTQVYGTSTSTFWGDINGTKQTHERERVFDSTTMLESRNQQNKPRDRSSRRREQFDSSRHSRTWLQRRRGKCSLSAIKINPLERRSVLIFMYVSQWIKHSTLLLFGSSSGATAAAAATQIKIHPIAD